MVVRTSKEKTKSGYRYDTVVRICVLCDFSNGGTVDDIVLSTLCCSDRKER